jgi:two-component system response regulator DesR
VAHEQLLLRSALVALLEQEPDFEVIATDWLRLHEPDRELRAHVCVADADCPGWRRHTGSWTRPDEARYSGRSVRGRMRADGRAAGRPVLSQGDGTHTGRSRRPVWGPGTAAWRPAPRGAGWSGGWAGGGNGHASGAAALVVLTGAGKPGDLRRAYEARALGFVSKDRSADRLPAAVRHAAEGKRFVDESLAVEFLQAADMPLTRRELSVLSLSAEGATVTEIARTLHLCDGTVRNYLAAIIRKTGARNRVDAIRISRVAGWV